jgi:hypothetical protein
MLPDAPSPIRAMVDPAFGLIFQQNPTGIAKPQQQGEYNLL